MNQTTLQKSGLRKALCEVLRPREVRSVVPIFTVSCLRKHFPTCEKEKKQKIHPYLPPKFHRLRRLAVPHTTTKAVKHL
jgi:hypothetical protein